MSEERCYYIYLLTNWNNSVTYVGGTNDLRRRLYEHQITVWTREKEIKKWRREKKNNLVVAVNPEWNDLSKGM